VLRRYMSGTAFLVCLALGIASPARGQQLVAVYPLQPADADGVAAQRLDKLLRLVSDQLPDIRIQSLRKTRRAIKRAAGVEQGCHNRLNCLVAVGELSAASLLVYGTTTRKQAGYEVDLRTIDIAQEKIIQRATTTIGGDAATLTDSMRGLVASLLMPDKGTGTLVVSMLVPGGHVILDGLDVGSTPIDPVRGLLPRRYDFEVTLEGAKPFKQSIYIGHGSTTRINISVEDERLLADISQESRMVDGTAPEVAELLARALLEPPAPPATTGVADATASDEPAPAAEVTPDLVEPTEPPWFAVSVGLLGVGAAAGVLGGVGLAMNGYGFLQTAGATEGDMVTDRATYDAMVADSDLYLGLGIGGAVALTLGLAAVGGGVGMLLLKGLDQPAGAEGAPDVD